MIPGWERSSWASAGADTQAQQVISQRDRTDNGWGFPGTRSRDTKPGLAQLKHARIPIFYTPDKLARGLRSRLAYHTWREGRLAGGVGSAPARSAAQDAAIARAVGLGRATLSESECVSACMSGRPLGCKSFGENSDGHVD